MLPFHALTPLMCATVSLLHSLIPAFAFSISSKVSVDDCANRSLFLNSRVFFVLSSPALVLVYFGASTITSFFFLFGTLFVFGVAGFSLSLRGGISANTFPSLNLKNCRQQTNPKPNRLTIVHRCRSFNRSQQQRRQFVLIVVRIVFSSSVQRTTGLSSQQSGIVW